MVVAVMVAAVVVVVVVILVCKVIQMVDLRLGLRIYFSVMSHS